MVLALDVWIVLSSARTSSARKRLVALPVAAAVLLVLYFISVPDWIPVLTTGFCIALYPTAYFHSKVLAGTARHRQVSVKTLVRCLLLASYSLVLISALAVSYAARLRGGLLLHVVSYALTAALTVVLAVRGRRGGILENVSRHHNATSIEEKIICSYSADYMGWVCSSRNNDAIFSRVELYFKSEEMPFCKSDLLLADVAKSVLTNKVYLSRAIHSKTGLNFCQYVNRFRVEYAKELYMKNPTLHVNELATMSGFATLTTFCSAFRAVEGMSPGDWTRVYIQNLKKSKQ